MSPVSPWIVPSLLSALLLTGWLVLPSKKGMAEEGRYATIDGLRGYLAFCVFLHHSCIWFFYLREGCWKAPPSALFNLLGQGGVAFFFMITAFLFTARVLRASREEMDWRRFVIARFMRLAPVYAVAIGTLFLIVAILSGGHLQVSIGSLLLRLLKWISFTAWGGGTLNGVKDTSVIVAGVTWSLPYEWCFYLSLPLMALAAGKRTSKLAMLLPLAGAVWLCTEQPDSVPFAWFLGGIAAALLAGSGCAKAMARHPLASLLVLACLGAAVMLASDMRTLASILPCSVAFVLVAAGCDVFGVLRWELSRCVGELAYSIYLLHGLLLFVTFRFVVGFENARHFSAMQHWALIAGLIAPLLLLTRFSFERIERPCMQSVDAVMARLQGRKRDSTTP